jgi:hypothetical protein
MFLVITRMRGEPRPAWHYRYQHAVNDLKARLGLERLHRVARVTRYDIAPSEQVRTLEGGEYRSVVAEDFALKPKSHPEHASSGVVTIYHMHRCAAKPENHDDAARVPGM